MKYATTVAFALVGLLVVSVVSSMHQAHALDPISFETLAPFSPTGELQIDSTAFSGDYRFEEAATGDLLAYISSILNDGLITDVRNTESSANVLGPGAVIYPNLFPWTNWWFYIDGTGSSTVDDASGTSIQYSQTLVNANYTTTSTITTQLIQGRTFMHVVSNMTFTNNIQQTQSINVEVDSASHHFNFASVYQDVLTGVPTVTTVNLQQHDGTHYYYDLDVGDSLVLYNTNSGSASVAMRYLGHSINGTDFTTMTEGGVIWNTNLIIDEVDNIELHPLEQSTGSGGTPGTVYSGTTIGLVYDIIVSTTEEKDLSSWVQFVDDGVSLESVDTQFQNVYETSGGDVYFTDGLDSNDRHHVSSFDVSNAQLKSYTTTITAGGDGADSNGNAGPVETRRYSIDLDSASSETIQAVDNTAGSPLDMYNNFTLMTYIKADATSGNIIRKESNYIMEFAGGGARCSFWSGGVLQSFAFTSAALNTGQWYHLACTYDGTTLRFYLDGVPQQNVAISATIDNTNDDLYIGSNGGGANFYDGKQKDVRIYNVYKTQAQVQAVVAGTDDTGGLAAMYDFAEGAISGNTETDDAGTNGLDGVLINTPSYSTDVPTNSYTRTSYYFAGRDSATGHNVYGLVDPTRGLQIADGFGVASSYSPRAIAQSLTKVYSPLYEATTYGKLYLSQLTRAFGSYSEPTLFTGNSTVPITSTIASQQVSGTTFNLGGTQTVVTERFTATAAALGKTFDSISFSLANPGARSGTVTVGTFDASGNVVTTFTTFNANTIAAGQATYTYTLSVPYTIQTNDRIGLKFTASGVNDFAVYYQATDVYDSINAYHSRMISGSWSDHTGFDTRFLMTKSANVKTVVYDGSPNDTSYTFFESGTGALRVAKYTSSASLLGTAMTHTPGQPYNVLQMSGKILIQTATDTYELNTSTDAITEVYNASVFLTAFPQSFNISPSTRTYITSAYLANSTSAYLYNPSAGTVANGGVLIDTATAPTLGVYDPAKYYYLRTNDLTVEASTAASSTWTVKSLGTTVALSITPWSEQVGINLVQNNTLVSTDVFDLSCDTGNYNVGFLSFSVGSDADCEKWRIFPESTELTTYRENFGPYSRTPDLVHTNTMTTYSFTLTADDPAAYMLHSLYQGKIVDTAMFDAAGGANQQYLFGQCYVVQIENVNTGSIVVPGQICANTAFSKTLNLAGLTVPLNWTAPGWTYTLDRTFSVANTTNSQVAFTVDSNPKPYNASIMMTDNFLSQYQTYTTWYNFTNLTNTVTINPTIADNATAYFIVYDTDMIPRITAATFGKSLSLTSLNLAWLPVGNIFGVSPFAFFIVIGAAIFVKTNASIGIIVVGALAGLMFAGGLIPLNDTLWGVVMAVVALGAIYAGKKLY